MPSVKRRRTAANTTASGGVLLTWRAKGSGNTYPVLIERAAADDECAISCELVSVARLDFVAEPLHHFVPGDTALSKATLPCGHAFAALPLAYHFLKNNMRCPVCRGGEDNCMHAQSVPAHVRGALTGRVQSTRAREAAQQRLEEHAANMASIREILAEQLAGLYAAAAAAPPFTPGAFPGAVVANVHIFKDRHRADYSVGLTLRLCTTAPGEYVLPRAQFRDLGRHLQREGATGFALSFAWEGIELSQTPMVRLPFFTRGEGGALEWEPNNRVLVVPDPAHRHMRVFGSDPCTAERQDSAAVFEHGAFAGDGLFLPFDSLRWVPGAGAARAVARFIPGM